MLLIQRIKQKLIKNVSVVQSYKPGKEANQELSSLTDHGEWISTYLQKTCLGKASRKKNAFSIEFQVNWNYQPGNQNANFKFNHHPSLACIWGKYCVLLKLPNSMGWSQGLTNTSCLPHLWLSVGCPVETHTLPGLQMEPGAMTPNRADRQLRNRSSFGFSLS